MDALILLLILDALSNTRPWLSVVRSQELIEKLPSENDFNPYLISRSPSGDLEINKEEDYDDGVSDPSLISTSRECLYYIRQLMGYIHEQQMRIEEFFFGSELRWSKPSYEPGILFEYFLLLVHRYVDLIAVEEVDAQDLYDLSEDDGEKFDEKKKIAQILLSLLNLASTDFRKNQHILPKLHALIDSVMRQFPDAMYLVVLADFSEGGFNELYLDEESGNTGMCICMNHESFHSERIFKTLGAFKHFQVLSYFTTDRLCSTITYLLKNYCEPHYSETHSKKAIVNFCAFLMKTLPNEAAFEAINQLFTELEKPAEMVAFLLEAILTIESKNLRGIIESPEFPIHPEESLKILTDFFSDVLTRKYDFWRIELKKLCHKKELVAALTAISKKSFVAGLIFEQIFYKSLFDSKRKLVDVFDAIFYESIQSVIDHSKMGHEISSDPQQPSYLWMLSFLERKFSSFSTMPVSTCLVHLERERQKLYDDKQKEYRKNVAGSIWNTKDSGDPITLKNLEAKGLFPVYRELCRNLEKVESSIEMLKKHESSQCLGEIEAEATSKVKRMNSEKEQRMCVHKRLLQEAKTSILKRLFCAQTSQEIDS
jgi:hypothetical protein